MPKSAKVEALGCSAPKIVIPAGYPEGFGAQQQVSGL